MSELSLCCCAEYRALHKKPTFECARGYWAGGCGQQCSDCGRTLVPREKRLGILESSLTEGIPMTEGSGPQVKIGNVWQDQMPSKSSSLQE